MAARLQVVSTGLPQGWLDYVRARRVRDLLQHWSDAARQGGPTLAAFGPRFLDGHVRANRQEPSSIEDLQQHAHRALRALKKAVEWSLIERVPCTIKLRPNPKRSMGFHDFEDYRRLLGRAKRAALRHISWCCSGAMLACDSGRSLRLNIRLLDLPSPGGTSGARIR